MKYTIHQIQDGEDELILYIEKVDDRTFAYTADREIQLDMSLSAIEVLLNDDSFFRCSKSMILNVNKVERLKSMASNRIDATLVNGEHIIISRKHASTSLQCFSSIACTDCVSDLPWQRFCIWHR